MADADVHTLLRDMRQRLRVQCRVLQRASDRLVAAAAQMNVCTCALAPQHALRVSSECLTSDAARTARAEAQVACVCAALLCGSVNDDELVRVQASDLVAVVPLLADWLTCTDDGDGTDTSACAVDSLAAVVRVHGATLLRAAPLRKTWRTVAAALHTWREQHTHSVYTHAATHARLAPLLQSLDGI